MPKRADSTVCSSTPGTILWFNSYFNFQKHISFRFCNILYFSLSYKFLYGTRTIQLRTSELPINYVENIKLLVRAYLQYKQK